MIPIFRRAVILVLVIGLNSCTQEMQNKISRSIQNYTGTNGVLDVLNNGKIMYRFIKIDKMSTAASSDGQNVARAYRFGYGYLDQNQNYHVDDNEKKTYFEVSDYSTAYVFYENPFDD